MTKITLDASAHASMVASSQLTCRFYILTSLICRVMAPATPIHRCRQILTVKISKEHTRGGSCHNSPVDHWHYWVVLCGSYSSVQAYWRTCRLIIDIRLSVEMGHIFFQPVIVSRRKQAFGHKRLVNARAVTPIKCVWQRRHAWLVLSYVCRAPVTTSENRPAARKNTHAVRLKPFRERRLVSVADEKYTKHWILFDLSSMHLHPCLDPQLRDCSLNSQLSVLCMSNCFFPLL